VPAWLCAHIWRARLPLSYAASARESRECCFVRLHRSSPCLAGRRAGGAQPLGSTSGSDVRPEGTPERSSVLRVVPCVFYVAATRPRIPWEPRLLRPIRRGGSVWLPRPPLLTVLQLCGDTSTWLPSARVAEPAASSNRYRSFGPSGLTALARITKDQLIVARQECLSQLAWQDKSACHSLQRRGACPKWHASRYAARASPIACSFRCVFFDRMLMECSFPNCFWICAAVCF
jgi:hypothetical protein